MYKGKTVSVAIASYNGEQFIEQQLESILNQTAPPDEIIISDDGSKDRTIDVVLSVKERYSDRNTIIRIITDNPRHGIGGNFEWAITHSSGDIIFICGQDDIWLQFKVEHIVDVFDQYPDAAMVCHALELIDDHNHLLNEAHNSLLKNLTTVPGALVKAKRCDFLERSISAPLISGTAVCISAELANNCMPIACECAEDQWLEFCAVASDGLYYKNEVLTQYRIHNSVSHSRGMSIHARIRKIVKRVQNANTGKNDLVNFAKAAEERLSVLEAEPCVEEARQTARRIKEIGQMEMEAACSGRIKGSIMLTKMYVTDMRYRRIGTAYFLTNLLNILIYGSKKHK